MIDTLLRQLNAALGKAFLFAGIIPSAVVIALHTWYMAGADELPAKVASLFDKETAALVGLVLLALSLTLQTARSRFLEELQTLPGSFFGLLPRLREFLIGRQLEKAQKAEQTKDLMLWYFTVMTWHREQGDLPPFRTPKVADEAVLARALKAGVEKVVLDSIKARGEINEILELRPDKRASAVSSKEKSIVDALALLYAGMCHASMVAGLRGEAEAWGALAGRTKIVVAPGAVVLDEYAGNYRRRVNVAFAAAQRFPRAESLRATNLGNQLAVLDEYADRHYRIGTATLWMRLSGLLSKEERAEVGDVQLRMESMVMLAVALAGFVVTTLIGWIYGIRPTAVFMSHGVILGSGWRMMAFVLASLAGAMLAYQSAIFACAAFSERVIQLIDTRRLEVIKAAGFPTPKTVAEELELFAELHKFFLQAIPRTAGRELRLPDEETPPPAEKPNAPAGGSTATADQSGPKKLR